ncbi:MAG: hypothetical protein IKS94_00665 [Prevotella sp.]|nr:hypothetical protein [Prevotella sp.]
MNEEILIQEKFGKKQPFRVPEGYFEHFAENMMAQLPNERAKVVKMQLRKHWKVAVGVAVAACFCAVLFSVGKLWKDSSDESLSGSAAIMQAQYSTNDDEFDDMVDYAMMDVSDIYYACAMDDGVY